MDKAMVKGIPRDGDVSLFIHLPVIRDALAELLEGCGLESAAALAPCDEETERLRTVLRGLITSVLSADEARLLMVGLGGDKVSQELHDRCDKMAVALVAARDALEGKTTYASRSHESGY